jgi:hypothetical protein
VARTRREPTKELAEALIEVAEAAREARSDEEALERSRARLRAAYVRAAELGASAILLSKTSGYSRQRVTQILSEAKK